MERACISEDRSSVTSSAGGRSFTLAAGAAICWTHPPVLPDARLTPRQTEVLAAYVRFGSQKAVSYALGISKWTVHNLMAQAAERLGASGVVETFRELGWLHVPTFPTA